MAIARSDLRKDVSDPLLIDSYEASAALESGPRGLGPNLKLILPNGTGLIKAGPYVRFSQCRLKTSSFYASQSLRTFGYLADILRADSMNTSATLMVAAIVKLPFVYWATIEQPKSWTYVRVIAFSPNSANAIAGSIVVGGPITGVISNAASKYKTAQLIGWISD